MQLYRCVLLLAAVTPILIGTAVLSHGQSPQTESSPAAAENSTTASSTPSPQPPGAQAQATASGEAKPDRTKKGNVPEIPLAQKPYNVVVEIGFEGDETSDPQIRDSLTEDIRKGLVRMYGPMWNASVRASDWLVPASSDRLGRLTEAELQTKLPDADTEKLILISISGRHAVYEVGCREYDVRVDELTPLLTEVTYDVQSLTNIVCCQIRDSFRPVLMLAGQSVDKTELEFHLQAGNLEPPDPTAAQIADGDVLRPFIRQLDRRNPGKIKSLQRLDLCYVRVTSFNEELHSDLLSDVDIDLTVEGVSADPGAVYTDNGHVRGVLISHGLVPFGGRGRSMQQIALRQRPAAASSRVRLVLQSRPDRPLICFRVDKVAKLRQTDVNEAPGVRMLSDRNGAIEINVDPENPTFWLYVYSGSALLARVPYAPGLIAEDTMKLPDDSVRLAVEGELYLLRDQLVDMVAQKAVYMSLAKKASAEGNPTALQDAIAQLDALPTQKTFDDLLNRTRTEAVARADQQKNSAAKRKVETLCRKMGESLALFFSGDKRMKEAQELEKLKQSAESRAAAAEAITPAAPTAPVQP